MPVHRRSASPSAACWSSIPTGYGRRSSRCRRQARPRAVPHPSSRMAASMTVDRYPEICAAHRWNVPAEFNIAHAVCNRHATEASRLALLWEDEAGATARYTFAELQQHANRLANALAACGVGRGDKVAIVLPRRPETAIA